ncbi:hypothetical protein MKK67_16500 [Methylobacterium sp. J-072]|uniref:hypothetical protein n=1 Tax=Methylobacterium sp. J-072 TaxID=2836651 RepID=UPI001FB8A66E|nr:hypothetical protein [Methylobacterium sp. J-072]MCJ2094079.1 hypothetical protein [Methylobacterium sp. J-072]
MSIRIYVIAFASLVGCSSVLADPKPSDATMMQRVLKKIEQDNSECNIGLSYAGRIAAGGSASSARFDGALVLVYSVEGCNGGNNWGYNAQVYGVKDDTALEIGKPQSWSIVKGADFNDKRAIIYAVSQGLGDGHCCPTEGKTIEVTVSNGQAVFRQIKAWHNSN